jgi:hypothetical protein
VDDFALTPAEQALFQALNRRSARFIGMGAAVPEGAPFATRGIDLWFERWDSEDVKQAAVEAGGFVISGFGMQPPARYRRRQVACPATRSRHCQQTRYPAWMIFRMPWVGARYRLTPL